MKRIAGIIPLLAAALMISALPALSDSGSMSGTQQQSVQSGQKDECLLVARNCETNFDTIHQRIDRLNVEIGKGQAVYTPEELGKLNDQLNLLMDVLMKDRPGV
jgi:hypothetical protein